VGILRVCEGWTITPARPSLHPQNKALIQNGGGLVVIHAADNSFPNWPAYNQMIGLGGWGDRTETDGPHRH